MANNIDINKIIGEVDQLNKSLADTATQMAKIIELQKQNAKELQSVKGLTDANEKLNTAKRQQSDIEKEEAKLLAERNRLIAAQDEKLKALTKSTLAEREAKKKYTEALKAEDDAYAKLNNKHTKMAILLYLTRTIVKLNLESILAALINTANHVTYVKRL